MADEWTWRDTAKEWARWNIFDKLYDALKPSLGKLTLGEITAVLFVGYAYLKGHPTLLLLGCGAALAFLFLLMAAFIQRAFGPRVETVAAIAKADDQKLKEIVNQTFERRDVLLDGYRYFDCTFTDITFVYNNGDAGGFDHTCRVGGKLGFKTEDPTFKHCLDFSLRSGF